MSGSKELNFQTERAADLVEKQDEFNYREIIGHLLDAKWTILAITAVVLFIAAFRAYTAVPIYQTDALLLIKGQDKGIPGLSTLESPSGGGSIQDKVDTIKSRLILGEAVDSLHMTYHVAPRYYPYIGSILAHRYHGEGVAEPLFGLNEYAWGGENLTVEHFEITGDVGAPSSGWTFIAGENQEYILKQGESEVLSGKVGETAIADYQGKKF
jgi:tyrosine-protein kinase Etk/Wzc